MPFHSVWWYAYRCPSVYRTDVEYQCPDTKYQSPDSFNVDHLQTKKEYRSTYKREVDKFPIFGGRGHIAFKFTK